jgi:hypothetical protein
MLHEILHTLGFVADNAPREHAAGHVPEPTDLMYAGPQPWRPAVLDVGQDDYYGGNVAADGLNFANSPFLLPPEVGSLTAVHFAGPTPVIVTDGPQAH